MDSKIQPPKEKYLHILMHQQQTGKLIKKQRKDIHSGYNQQRINIQNTFKSTRKTGTARQSNGQKVKNHFPDEELYEKKYSISLVLRKMKSEITIICHFLSSRLAKHKKSDQVCQVLAELRSNQKFHPGPDVHFTITSENNLGLPNKARDT